MANSMEDTTPRRRTGRPAKYKWDDKRDLCYKLYVEERKSAAEIAKYFAEQQDADASELPCRKGFLRQFAAWGFPSHTRKLTPEDEAVVLARIYELWNQNVNQKDIKRQLLDEGHELKDYDFTKIWKKSGLRLRNDQGYKLPDAGKNKRKRDGRSFDEHAMDAGLQAELEAVDSNPSAQLDHSEDASTAALDPEQAALRAQRLHQLQVESDQRLASRKRRRRIRGYGHLPPDAPGTAPRYNSETSLDECKAHLHLSNEMYQTVRKDFQTICEEMNIIKKTQCAEGAWDEAKNRLIRENMHLTAMTHPLQPDQEKKATALECLCADVTKRMRVAGKAITIAEANNILLVNPSESKTIRRSLYEILAADKFESRLVCGEDHWQILRQRWYDTNAKLQQAINEKDDKKSKAIDLLCSDAMKRFREDRNKRGEREVVQSNAKYGPGPGPAWAATAPRSRAVAVARAVKSVDRSRSTIRNDTMPDSTALDVPGDVDFELDPALTSQGPFPQPQLAQPVSAYFRLSQGSHAPSTHPEMWLGKLESATMGALYKSATANTDSTRVTKVHGIIKGPDGNEDSWQIDMDDELQVYLEAAGSKPTFKVMLED